MGRFLARRGRRRSSRAARWFWGAALLAGYLGWCLVVERWAVDHHHTLLLGGWRPLYALVAAATYFPPAILLWRAMYPGDDRFLPWDQD